MHSEKLFASGGFTLQGREALGVYLLLRVREAELDVTMLALLNRLERELYRQLTIAEFEDIEKLYNKKI